MRQDKLDVINQNKIWLKVSFDTICFWWKNHFRSNCQCLLSWYFWLRKLEHGFNIPIRKLFYSRCPKFLKSGQKSGLGNFWPQALNALYEKRTSFVSIPDDNLSGFQASGSIWNNPSLRFEALKGTRSNCSALERIASQPIILGWIS